METGCQLTLPQAYPEMTEVGSIGQSVQSRELMVSYFALLLVFYVLCVQYMRITSDPHHHVPLRPMFKLIWNMHGNEVTPK